MPLFDHLLDATAAQADKRKLGSDEERVQKNEYPDCRQAYGNVYDVRGSLRPDPGIGAGRVSPRSLDADRVPQSQAVDDILARTLAYSLGDRHQ